MSEPQLEQRTWACIGRRLSVDGKSMRQHWREVVNDEGLGDERVFKDRTIRGAHAGMMYSVHVSRDGDNASLFTGGANAPSFKGRWHNSDKIVEWECAEAAHEARQRRAKLAADAAKVDEIVACLRPIVAAMRTTDRAGRRAIKTLVLEILDAESTR